jgi:hypothetical protein
MTDTFHASYLKVDRAKQHLEELERVIDEWRKGNPVTIMSKVEGRGVSFTMKADPVPSITSAIVGDIFHNLRSSLDLMAAEMCGGPGSPDPDVYFPFCSEQKELDGMIKRRNFDRAGPAAIKLLREWKPYRGGNAALRAIHDLNVRDKHQMLIVNPMSFASPIIDTRPPEGGIAIVGDPTKPSELKLVFPGDCALSMEELIPTLHKLVDLTASVIESFKSLRTPAG